MGGHKRPVTSIDETGKRFTYPSITEAAEFENGTPGRITMACRTGNPYLGFYWEYADTGENSRK